MSSTAHNATIGARRGRRRRAIIALAVLVCLILVLLVQPSALVDGLARAFPGVVWRVETREPVVALTFDDGPDPVYTPQVLEFLARHNVRATFFLVGERARRHPALVERIRRAGHQLGNHTDSMATTLFLPTKKFGDDLLRAESALGPEAKAAQEAAEAEEKAGARQRLKFFRPAGGWIWPAQLKLAKAQGYTCVLGSAYAYDPYRPPAAYIRWAIGKNLRPGVVVVLHDSGGNRSNTVAALEGILEVARRKGLRWVTLSELFATAS